MKHLNRTVNGPETWMIRRCLSWLLPLYLLCAGPQVRAEGGVPFLWEVHGAKATHYLLGSVHLLPDNSEELPQGIAEAYDASDAVVFETDLGALSQPRVRVAMLAAARSQPGLKAEIGGKMYEQLERYSAHIGMPVSACDPFKPWFCAMTLEVFSYRKAGFSGENGIDEQIYHWALEDGKDVRWLEAPAAHIGLFTGMNGPLAREFLASAMDEQDGDSGDDPEQMLRAWRDNDVGVVEALDRQLKHGYPQVYDHLLAQRNRNWMPQLKRIFDGDEPELVVVGAAHLVGPDGLIAALRAHGYKVAPYSAVEQQLMTMARAD
ncbi:MAG: TraB/GumN family protein [Nevskia sp.]|nr:TraB/GumN family protein [Nevskia sp.]